MLSSVRFGRLISDTLDIVVPRDLAAARYALYHEWMDKLLGPTRLDQMTAPAPVYDASDVEKLEEQLKTLTEEVDSITTQYTEKKKAWNASADDDTSEAEAEPWARGPSAGRILGIGYVPADMPPEVAAHFEAQAQRRRERDAQQLPLSKTPEEIQAMIQEVNQRYQSTSTMP